MSCPKIFYFCFSHNRPTGGQKDTYKHVDILNSAGFESYVFHLSRGFRVTWFENNTRVVGPEEFTRLYNAQSDYIVLPEDLGAKISSFPGRKVIFNKGIYLGFRAFGSEKLKSYPYLDPDVLAVLTVSNQNAEHLKFAYPFVDVIRVYSEIDTKVFAYTPLDRKKPRISCIPKAHGQLLTLYHILHSRAEQNLNQLDAFDWTFIQSMSERDVAKTLQESLVFVFLSTEEGLPRTPIEAMSCGCLLACYREGPLRECLPAAFQFETGDIVGVAKYIELIAKSLPSRLSEWEPLALAGRELALSHSSERQRISVLEAWERILHKTL